MNHVHSYIYCVYCSRKDTLHLLFMVNNEVHQKIKNSFVGLVVRKNIKCNRKGRMCLSAAFIWFLEKDFYFIKVIKIGFLWISLLTKIKPHIHVFKIYMCYELCKYVLKVYVAYVNSTVISKIVMLVENFSFFKYIIFQTSYYKMDEQNQFDIQ